MEKEDMDTVNDQPQAKRNRRDLSALRRYWNISEETQKKHMALAEKSTFKFWPSDKMLVRTFLMKYMKGDVIPFKEEFSDADFYSYSPFKLYAMSKKGQSARDWYYFARKHEEHEEPIRVVPRGFWKQVGDTEVIVCDDSTVGYKKSFFFYEGDTQFGKRTVWQLAEYGIIYEDIIRSTPGTSNSVTNGNTKVYDKVICKMFVQVRG